MRDAYDEQLQIAGIYAEALYELAKAQGRVADVQDELDELVKLEQQEPMFADFMSSSAIDDDRREAGLEAMLRGKLSDEVLNTLLVMNRRGRYGMTWALARRFQLAVERDADQIEATVVSAVELDDAQRGDVADTVRKLAGKEPLIDYHVDAELLGGLIVEIGDLRFDNSVRRQLQRTATRLMERGERGFEGALAETNEN